MHESYRYSAEEINSMLGSMSDYKLAKLLGVSTYVVKSRRKRLGIDPYSPNTWTEENLALLGTMPDKELAQLIDSKTYLVSEKRQSLKIKAYKPADYKFHNSSKTVWTEEMLADLGTMSDYKVGKKYGICPNTARDERLRRGILCFKKTNRWNPTLQWTPELDALLGTMSDRDLSKRLGVSYHVVLDRRLKLGITCFTSQRVDWTEDKIALLGTMADSKVAELLGCSERTVSHKRRKLGITAHLYTKGNAHN